MLLELILKKQHFNVLIELFWIEAVGGLFKRCGVVLGSMEADNFLIS
jgi:hypothetical protein